ncbi:hypothetical protein BGP_6063 [Beggiatoa sp. PS]|nr:hypothetical protein BGP_6063 [Beggiatoa sp. PS]
MNIETQILHELQNLPLEKQHEVLDFVDFLVKKTTPTSMTNSTKPRSFKGIFANLGVHITEEDIAEVRREMWGTSQKESA